jgi:hypothetical protein
MAAIKQSKDDDRLTEKIEEGSIIKDKDSSMVVFFSDDESN